MGFEQSIENGTATSRDIEGRKVLFGIISYRDLGKIRATMPDDERRGATANDVWYWCKSPDGLLTMIALSAQKFDPLFTEEQVNTMALLIGIKELGEEIQEASAGKPQKSESAEGNPPADTTTN